MGEEMNDIQHKRETNVQIRRLATFDDFLSLQEWDRKGNGKIDWDDFLAEVTLLCVKILVICYCIWPCKKNLNFGESQVTQRVNDKISCSGGPNSTVMCSLHVNSTEFSPSGLTLLHKAERLHGISMYFVSCLCRSHRLQRPRTLCWDLQVTSLRFAVSRSLLISVNSVQRGMLNRSQEGSFHGQLLRCLPSRLLDLRCFESLATSSSELGWGPDVGERAVLRMVWYQYCALFAAFTCSCCKILFTIF